MLRNGDESVIAHDLQLLAVLLDVGQHVVGIGLLVRVELSA